MTMNPLPPQAYTKETLLKAFDWLQSQPPSIREMAMSPDILVSLFNKASREGDRALERPSIQNFKNELKNLAGIMGEFDPPPALVQTAAKPIPRATHSTAPKQYQPAAQPPVSAMTTSFVSPEASGVDLGLLDSKSQEMIKEIQADFNLTNEVDALRMLIKIGHAKAKGLLKS